MAHVLRWPPSLASRLELALMALVPPPMVTVGLTIEDAPRGSYKTSYAMEMAVACF
jgi:hypothetical protein